MDRTMYHTTVWSVVWFTDQMWRHEGHSFIFCPWGIPMFKLLKKMFNCHLLNCYFFPQAHPLNGVAIINTYMHPYASIHGFKIIQIVHISSMHKENNPKRQRRTALPPRFLRGTHLDSPRMKHPVCDLSWKPYTHRRCRFFCQKKRAWGWGR